MSSSWDSSTTADEPFSVTATAYSLFASDQSSNVLSPFRVLQDLVATLQTNNVPGPFLLRMETEFTHELGEGATAEVRALDKDSQRRFCSVRDEGGSKSLAGAAGLIAVKQHKSRRQGPPTPLEAPTFLASHFKDAMREILALTHPGLRHHPNIVNLMGWGLCLDALEDADLDKANIPLLVLEKAHGDMLQVLQRDQVKGQKLDFKQRLGFCRDVGMGLQALHDNSLTHGDLKTANVLVFATATGLRAKLCDFGTIHYRYTDHVTSESHSRYRGTPGWRPPEILSSTTSNTAEEQKLVRCDVYAYGLVVWSIFVGQGKTCVQDESSATIKETAIRSLERTLQRSASSVKLRQLTQVLSASLPFDPSQRSLRPWSELLSARERMLENVSAREDVPGRSATGSGRPTVRSLTSSWQPRDLLDRIRSLMSSQKTELLSAHDKVEAYKHFAESAGLTDIIHTGQIENSNDDPNSLATLEHQGGPCLDLRWFERIHDEVYSFFKNNEVLLASQYDTTQRKRALYCYARYRSRIKLCCWTTTGRKENIVEELLSRGTKQYEFAILAWLCKGEVGVNEVSGLRYKTAIQEFRDKSKDESRRLETFLMLMQSGFAIETSFGGPYPTHRRANPGLRSALRQFIDSLRTASRGTAMRLICERFRAVNQLPQIGEATIDFMLGPEETGPDTDNWTALHEAVSEADYDGVRHLLDIGADTERQYREPHPFPMRNRQLIEGVTPYEMAILGTQRNRAEQLARERILALLGPSGFLTRSRSPYLQDPSRSLPQGWTSSKIHTRPMVTSWRYGGSALNFVNHVRTVVADGARLALKMPRRLKEQPGKIDTVYRETFTGSLTFKQPRFSLLTSGRAALGYRKVQGYSLDLIAFLEPPTSTMTKRSIDARFPLIDDGWYRQEPLTAAMTDDPLKDLAEPWTNFFSLPQLDFSVESIADIAFSFVQNNNRNDVLLVIFFIFFPIVIISILWKGGYLEPRH